MKVIKASKMKIARELSYKTVTGLLPVLQRFADSLGVYDINELSDIICNMSVDAFCDFKFSDSPPDPSADAISDLASDPAVEFDEGDGYDYDD